MLQWTDSFSKFLSAISMKIQDSRAGRNLHGSPTGVSKFPELVLARGLDLPPPGLSCFDPATLGWGTFGNDTSVASLRTWVRSGLPWGKF